MLLGLATTLTGIAAVAGSEPGRLRKRYAAADNDTSPTPNEMLLARYLLRTGST
jgi:hypothetical protein